MRSIKWIVMIMVLGSCSALMAQQENKAPTDTAAVAQPNIEAQQTDSTMPKTDGKKADKKKKKEKVDKKAAKAAPQTTEQNAQTGTPPAEPDSTQQAPGKKGKKSKPSKATAKVDPKKTASNKDKKPEKPKPVPHAKPGAEADANAKVKDPVDRTRKGPSGQKVYMGPRGSLYYINSNGQKVFLKQETPK